MKKNGKCKVGIINFHCADNFGAVLQALALQQTIEMLGYNAEIINFRPEYILNQTKTISNINSLIKAYKFHSILKKIVIGSIKYKSEKQRIKRFTSFRERYLNLTNKEYFISEDLINDCPTFDYYITGSDQVWNPTFKRNIGDSYFLDFVPNGPSKISYAASIAEKVEDNLIDDYKKLIGRFDYISIREKSSLEFINSISEKEVEVTLDPTLLLEKEKWRHVTKEPGVKEKYLLVYDLEKNDELIYLANKISRKTGFKIISYSKSKEFINPIDCFKYKGPDEFLGYFENAELILTNSYHGTIFSIIFLKIFYTVPHKTRGTRMTDLLEELNLSNRVIHEADDLEEINNNIDYKRVHKILQMKRKQSIDYLVRALNREIINED